MSLCSCPCRAMSLPGFAAQGIVLRDGDDAYLQFLSRVLHRSSHSGWTVADHNHCCCPVCPCCRVPEQFSFCWKCLFILNFHRVVLQIRRFAPPSVTISKVELHHLFMVGAHFGLSPSVLRAVAGFLGVAFCPTTTFVRGLFRAMYFERVWRV